MIPDFLNGYKERLVLLMVAKQNALHDLGINEPLYFTDKDAEAIRKWPWHRSVLTWLKIVGYVKDGKSCGLDGSVCPFCLYHKHKCSKCEYGFNHIPCGRGNSHYKNIVNQLKRLGIKSYNKLTPTFYQQVIYNIQKGNWPLY